MSLSTESLYAAGQTIRNLKPEGEADQTEQTFRLTEYGNAERLVARFGDHLHYCYQTKEWFHWDETRWTPDATAEVERLAKETVRSMYVQAGEMERHDDRKALADWARRSEAAGRIQAMIALARSEPRIPVLPNQLDADHWLLNVANGTIDLRTGECRQHSRQDLLTKLAPVVYDPGAKCPRWTRFLEEIFDPHPDLIAFSQTMVGYMLTGDTREECLFLASGAGRNGKGTFTHTIATMLGDYAGTADFSTFIATRDDARPRDDIANMRGKRLITSQESREGAIFAESIVKWLTGGDRVRARRLYENSFEFDPTHKLLLATNHKPEVRGTDVAIWSRIKLIPFDVCFDGREDKSLKTTLIDELPGILAWAVEGCLRWREDGLGVPPSVLNATKEYRNKSDQVGRFIAECCVVGEYASGKARGLYLAYRKWAEESGETATSEITFLDQVSDRGFKKDHTRSGSVYSGIGLKVSSDEP